MYIHDIYNIYDSYMVCPSYLPDGQLVCGKTCHWIIALWTFCSHPVLWTIRIRMAARMRLTLSSLVFCWCLSWVACPNRASFASRSFTFFTFSLQGSWHMMMVHTICCQKAGLMSYWNLDWRLRVPVFQFVSRMMYEGIWSLLLNTNKAISLPAAKWQVLMHVHKWECLAVTLGWALQNCDCQGKSSWPVYSASWTNAKLKHKLTTLVL